MSGSLTLGNSYFELTDDGVVVHTLEFLGGVLVGEQRFKITYTEFNTILQSGLTTETKDSKDWEILNRFMTTRDGVRHYLLPVGTFEVFVKEDGLHVKQKVGSSGWNLIDCYYGADYIQADWGSVYSVEWLLTGNIHTIRGRKLVQAVAVEKVVSGVLGTNTCELVPVPFLLDKLQRESDKFWSNTTKLGDRKNMWISGAEPYFTKVMDEDMRNSGFRNEVLRSARDRDAINWEAV